MSFSDLYPGFIINDLQITHELFILFIKHQQTGAMVG